MKKKEVFKLIFLSSDCSHKELYYIYVNDLDNNRLRYLERYKRSLSL